ncbi:hypothetical protein BD289DRAFT_437010 [Coniella lustricola]|uniref:DUF7053 domain-containing protein n=1 Tax=Coniella lustricola TaxID=2025994 RepID=A0A2T3A4J6_9PEZI|nr:hypothetical protein BD289DRAFT_437010 [Coniella lustricola]
MSWLTSKDRVLVKTRLPAGVSRQQAVDMLHDRDFFINCDPSLEKYEVLDKDLANPDLPAGRVQGIGPTTSYKITDVVANVPKSIWGSSVESTYEFTDVERGLFCRIRSPLSIVMEALWEVREAEDGEGLEIVEEADIKCSRLLMGVVKSQTEQGAPKIHSKMLERLKSELAATST